MVIRAGTPQSDYSAAIALGGSGLSKRYGETIALATVDISLPVNRVIGLVGENGAGKSTLLNILSGIAAPDSGELEIHGVKRKLAGYAEAQRLGITRVFQEQALILNIPVYENLLLGSEVDFVRFGQIVDRPRMVRLAQEMLEQAGISIHVRRTTQELSFSERQLIEIARACIAPRALFGVEHPIVLFDEPTASLEKGHERIFINLLNKVRQEGTALFVSHRLGEVLNLCDEIVVLKDGRRVGAVEPASADEQTLHRMMVGRARDTDYYHEGEQVDATTGRTLLAVRNLTKAGSYEGINLEVRGGEILGIGGLLETGKSALGKGIAGVEASDSGEVQITAGAWARPNMARLIAAGVGYVPAERLIEGMIVDQPVAWNISLASGHDLFANGLGIWRHAREREVSARLIDRLRIKGALPQLSCKNLSGGNQQKVVLARWLARTLHVIILDNPTRGVDAGAKEEIYGLLRELTNQGVAIVLITDELLELIGMSNRIAVMRHGRIRTIIDSPTDGKPSEQELVEAMLSSDEAGQVSARAA